MNKKLSTIFLLLIGMNAMAQIINVENLRRESDTTKWSGYTRLDLHLIKNKNSIFGISNRTRIQYKSKAHLWLFLNDLDFREVNANTFVSKNAQHIRYNYLFNEKIALEAFLQAQNDEISSIRFRGLVGTGIRYTLTRNESYKLFVGTLFMYEHENINSSVENNNRDWRSSSYVSMRLFPKETISIVSTTYFQPRFDAISDFRISSQTSIALDVFKNVSFTTNFTYEYDRFPVLGIPREQYRLTNGVLYSF